MNNLRSAINLAGLAALSWLMPYSASAFIILVAICHGRELTCWAGSIIEHWLNQRDRRRLKANLHAEARWVRP